MRAYSRLFALLVFALAPAVASAQLMGQAGNSTPSYNPPLTIQGANTPNTSPAFSGPLANGGGGVVNVNTTATPAPGGLVLILCAFPLLCLGYWRWQRRREVVLGNQL